ncbi:hypothetical protein BH20ACT15_BH20ACT15_08100 [soil metagenome]
MGDRTNGGWKCPECGDEFASPARLADHATTEHVAAETPAAGLRRPRSVVAQRVLAGVAVVAGLGFFVLVGVGALGDLDKEGAPETPSSAAHKIAADVVNSSEADEYRAVVPEDGWDVEYELDGDGLVRVRDEGPGANAEIEVVALDGDLEDAMAEAATERGFEFGN